MLKNLSVFVSIVEMTVLMIIVPFATYGKDTLIIGKQDDTVSLDPAKAYEQTSWGILNQVYERLVNFKGGDYTHVVPELAESWEFSADGKTWIFHLRKDVKFSTGNPLTVEAVVFSLRRAIALGSTSSWVLTQFGLTEDAITAIDDATVQIVLENVSAPGLFLACLTPPIASILDPKAVMEHDRDGDMGSAWLEESSAGSNAFVLSQQKRGDFYELTANQYYRNKPPTFPHVLLKNVQDPLEQLAMLEQGTIDIAWDLKPDQVNLLVDNPNIQIQRSLTFLVTYLLMNLGTSPLDHPAVRDAIRYAIDYDGIIDFILQGAGQKLQTFIPPGLIGYNPAMPYTHNVQKAKQLLAEAGSPDGFEIELKFLNYAPWVEIAEKITQDLAEIGIKVHGIPSTAEHLMQEAWGSGRNFQMMIWEWGFDYPDPDAVAKPFAHSDSLNEDATFKALAWWCRYVNLETSALTEQAAHELDSEKRIKLYQQITDIILDDGPFAMLYTQMHQYGVRSEIADLIKPPVIIWIPFPSLQ